MWIKQAYKISNIWSIIDEVGIELIEFADGYSKAIPKNIKCKYLFHFHTSSRARGFLNNEKTEFNIRKLFSKYKMNYGLKRNFLRADSLLACSYEIALLQCGMFGIHPNRIRVIPHAFHPDTEKGFSRKSEDTHDNFFLVIGNLEYLKGFDLMIKAFGQYIDNGGQGKILFAGSTGWNDKNTQVQEMLNIEVCQKFFSRYAKRKVEFLGQLSKNDLAGLRSRATAVVIPSRFEAFTMVAGEAFMSNTPVILSDRTGWRFPVARFDGARLVDPYNEYDFSKAFSEMEDAGIRKKYQDGAQRMGAYLSSHELVQQTISFYASMLG